MTNQTPIHPPYIWFGGKRKVAGIVWDALGDVDNYVEPFFGGGSVWLLRPHSPRLETINDYDGFVSNFWRAVQHDPDGVADAMDWPVNEIDLEARHCWLCRMPDKEEFLERMKHDPDHYDVKRAAWWCWGLNVWIASGWCEGEYYPDKPGESRGVGIHRKRPHLGNSGVGIHRLGNVASTGTDAGACHDRREWLRAWMRSICDRLRKVRVCCGDWARICTDGATAHGTIVGVFLDPPYSAEADRKNSLYRCEDLSIAHRVRDWCAERTGNPRYRIALCGYAGEHDALEAMGWRVHAWKTVGGFANFGVQERGKANTGRERIWFSPSCIGCVDETDNLFTIGA